MIETRVRVLKAGDGLAWVEATEQNGCAACRAGSDCAVSGLGRFFSSRRQPIPVYADDARPGQQFTMAMGEADFLKMGLMAYLIPSLLAVGGAALASANHPGDVWPVVGMVLGFLLGLLPARLFSGRVAPTMTPYAAPECPPDALPSLPSNQGETP